MSADANRCPGCGAERPANAAEGLCPRCLMRPPMTGDTPGPPDATTAHAIAGSDRPPAPTAADPEATRAHIAATVGSTGPIPHDATGARAPSPELPTRTTDGHGDAPDLPRGATVHYFGDYEIQKELGRGGMGVVYKARQVSLNRPVALKMIKAGVLADEAELRRFHNEAEAVALLDHAGVVPVYEVGEHDGQKYFSMKLVEGGNLADKLDGFIANPRAAATLLAQTAEAVHHAHMRGILHRDLKPANILIDAQDHPHVTDFGLAKRVEAGVEMTASGAILGTPAYMSPEQASGRRGTITTATDVYGLGAILYALLTGKAPFGSDSLADTLQAVRDRPPETPRNHNANVPRDLETICLNCLAKDPRRRYASAQALADDLRCWLDSRPIAAPRVGPAERAWLWCKRKPAIAALAAAVLLAVVGGTTGILIVQAKANADLRSANGKLDQANTQLRSSNTLLERQRSRAEEREKQAIDAVKRFHDAVGDNPDLKNNPALESLRKTLLKEPLAFFRSLRASLQADGDTKPESIARLADAAHDYAHISDEIGDKEDSLRGHFESQAIWERLTRDHPQNSEFQAGLAKVYFCQGKLLADTGRPVEAKKSYERAVAIYEKLTSAKPSDASLQNQFALSQVRRGTLLEDSGNPTEAMKAYESAAAIIKNLINAKPTNLNDHLNYQSNLAGIYMNIGVLQKNIGQPDEASKSLGNALPIWQKLARDFPHVVEAQSNLGATYQNIGTLLADTGKPAEAMKSFDRALAIWRKLTDAHPTVTEFQNNLASIHMLIARLQDGNEALESQRRAAAIWKKLIDAHPTVTAYRYNLAGVLTNMAGTQHNMAQTMKSRGDNAEALALFQKARSNSEAAVRADGANVLAQVNLSNHHWAIGKLLEETGKPAEALESCKRALAIRRRLADEHPADPGFLNTVADFHNDIGIQEQTLGKPAEAMASYEQSRVIKERLTRNHPESPDFACGLAGALSNMAELDLGSKRFEEARARLRQAITLQKKALATAPRHATCRAFLTIHLDVLVKADKELGRADEAALAQRALEDLKAGDPGIAALDARLSALLNADAP
jgi:tetratricopeptide (TPR) repeat protein/tRNA A-37 threonylcarbamoyl transferase component Bud32